MFSLFRNGRRCFSSVGTAEFHLVRRKEKYKQLANSLKVPHAKYCIAGGQKYDLPWRPEAPLIDTDNGVPQHMLEYFAIWLSNRGSIMISMTSLNAYAGFIMSECSYRRADVLIELARAFGGIVRSAGRGHGLECPSVCWYLGDRQAKRAASILMHYPSTVQKRYEVMSRWCAPAHRKILYEEMLQIRTRRSSPPAFEYLPKIDSVVQLAAIIDSTGTISCMQNAYPALCFSHFERGAFEAINSYLISQGLSPAPIQTGLDSRGTARYYWTMSKYGEIVALMKLVYPHLIYKRCIADLFISNQTPWSFEVLQRFRDLNGSQNRAKRHDGKGIELIRQIKRLRWKVAIRRSRGSSLPNDEFEEAIRAKQAELSSNFLNGQISVYRSTIKNLLNAGATSKN